MNRSVLFIALIGLVACSAEGDSTTASSSSSKRLFVMDALSAKISRDSSDSTAATLQLTGVAPTATWFTVAPARGTGAIASSDFGGPTFYNTAGDASTWLGQANAAMYYRTNNSTTGGQTTILSFNGAPTISADKSTWIMNVTVIERQPARAQSFMSTAKSVTQQGPVALFIDDLCYNWLFGYWYVCY